MTVTARGLSGRDRELDEADVALATAASGTPRALLVGGDAGIGKTTLVAEISRRAAERGFTVLTGHCLDVDTERPLAAVLEALRGYVESRDPGTLPAVTRRIAPFLAGNTVVAAPTDLVSDSHAALLELTRQAPVLLLVEDMHWSGRSTREFTTSAAKTLVGRFVLVLTYRSDDLTRRHPFRRTLLEIGRGVGSHRMDLGPLDRDAMSNLVRAATGAADPALVGAVLARSEGNPLFAEELLRADPTGVPGPLNELLLARVDALTPSTVELLRLASVNGTRIDSDLLVEVTGFDWSDVEAGLREALDARVLSSTDQHLDFWHGLLHEAVYDDLLPGERTRTHGRFAEALEGRLAREGASESVATLARLAYHWNAAGDQPHAFVASLRAGLPLYRLGQVEAIGHLERALDLWDQVPDPEVLGGTAKADVLRRLAVGTKGVYDRDPASGMRFMREALELVEDTTDRLLASRVYATYGELYREVDGAIGQVEAIARAVEYAEGPPSAELAAALLARFELHERRFEPRRGLAFAVRSAEVARTAGLPDQEAEALWLSGMAAFDSGAVTNGMARVHAAAAVAGEAGVTWLGLTIQSDLACLLLLRGRAEEAAALSAEGRARAQLAGLHEPASIHGEQLVQVHRWVGRLEEADLLLEELHEEGMSPFRWKWQRAANLQARGELEAAVALDREVMATMDGLVLLVPPEDMQSWVDVLCGVGRAAEACEVVDRYRDETRDADADTYFASAADAAWTALAAARDMGIEAPQTLVACSPHLLTRALAGTVGELEDTVFRAEALTAAAIAATLDGGPAVGEWRAAASSATRYGEYYALRSRIALANALLGAGERDEGRALLVETWQSARDMGARGRADEAATVARRSRVQLPDHGGVHGRLAALTVREREVLAVLSTGATNRDIAERLFISQKTVSVHISNILAKLGVPNRGAAAALARELAEAEDA